MGTALAWGDFNGDLIGDLAIGAPGRDVFVEISPSNGFVANAAGIVRVLLGNYPNGLTASDGARRALVSQNSGGPPDFAPLRPDENDHFGEVLTAGDFNGDRFTDLAVGTPDEDLNGIRDVGVVQVFLGRAPDGGNFGFLFPEVLSLGDFIDRPEADDEFGASLAAGDFDLNGRIDLAIGVPKREVGPSDDAGMVCITSGIQPGRVLIQSDLLTNASETFDKFGSALAAGDFNGDFFRDLAVGVPFEDVVFDGETVSNAGEVNVVYGSAQGLRMGQGQGQRIAQGVGGIGGLPDTDDRFGTSLSAWNFGRNLTLRDRTGQLFIFQTSDLAIGVPFEDLFTPNGELQQDSGAIHVLYGGLNGLTSANNQFLHQGNIGGSTIQAFDRFGRFLY